MSAQSPFRTANEAMDLIKSKSLGYDEALVAAVHLAAMMIINANAIAGRTGARAIFVRQLGEQLDAMGAPDA